MTAPRRRDEAGDRGAIAVITALVVVVVLIPVAALGLDLGNNYSFGAALQRAADAAATAGAQELARRQRGAPASAATQAAAIQGARDAAIAVLCHDPFLDPGPPDALGVPQGPWHARCTGAGQSWATDGDSDPHDPNRHPNGEIEFYTGSPAASTGTFPASQRVYGSTPDRVSGIRVVTPPATVPYAIAPVVGVAKGVRQSWATAQLRSVLPAHDFNGDAASAGRNLQLYLTPSDLAPSAAGRPKAAWCIRSAPRQSWDTGTGESNHPTGVCDNVTYPSGYPWVPRGYLTSGSDSRTLLVPGQTTVQLEPQHWTDVARLRDLRAGLFDGGGRLVQSGCRGGNSAQTGGYTGIESARLGDFVDTGIGSVQAFETQLLAGVPPSPGQEGWLSPDVLKCGRLAVLPVLSGLPSAPPQLGVTTTGYPVASLQLVWLDSTVVDTDPTPIATATTNATCLARGFYWESPYTAGWCPPRDETNAPLRAITGYLVDPRYLPTTVTGDDAANTAPYLGSGLPTTVRLVRDLSDPPAT